MLNFSNIEHNVEGYWNGKVSTLVNLKHSPIIEGQKKHHRLSGLLLMEIVHNHRGD